MTEVPDTFMTHPSNLLVGDRVVCENRVCRVKEIKLDPPKGMLELRVLQIVVEREVDGEEGTMTWGCDGCSGWPSSAGVRVLHKDRIKTEDGT
jgi:hypothetical protein